MPIGSNSESTSPTRLNSNNNVNGATDRKNSLDSSGNGGGGKLATMSYDPTSYIQRARVTRPAPPKPSSNPMQFVQIKPCNLYQTAQEQLKKAEEVKKVKEIIKEDPEDWQSNLDNWKSSRRKRVEHIIDRVVEVKKLELEEHDRTRRKSKTFSEMLEERSSRRTKLASLAVYTEDESNDLSDLGIGTSSTSGKSSLSEDYDNHSVMSDNVDTEKPTSDIMVNHHLNHENGISNRDYISSPGYETSSSTAPTSSPDPCEYTYEGAIQDYKTRVSKAQSNGFNRSTVSSPYSKDSTPERNTTDTTFSPRRSSGSKIENRLMNFEVKSSSSNDQINELNFPKKDLPKVDILKRRELFEKDNNGVTSTSLDESNCQKRLSGDFTNTKSIRERLSNLEKKPSDDNKKANRLSGDIASLKDRLQNLERQSSVTEKSQKIDVPVVPLKDRLSSLQNAATKEEVKKPVLLVDEHQLEMLKKEDLEKQHTLKREMLDNENFSSSQEILNLQDESNVDTDREDSGIHTTDVSCSVSQTDEQPDLVNEESHHHINAEDGLCQNIEQQLKNTEIHEKCKESRIPDVVRNFTMEQMSSKMEQQQQKQQEQSQQQQQQQLLPDDNNSGTSPEPTIDQETSVSLSLSESPTASSQQTIIFNNKMASETGGSLENITSISQLSVEGVLGVDYSSSNSSNKQSVVSTNTLFTCAKNSKFDIENFEIDSKKTMPTNQIVYDFTKNNTTNSKNTETNFEKSKFIIENNGVVEDKINIEKWIEQNFEQNKDSENNTNIPSNIDIESSNTSFTNKSSPTKIRNENEISKELHENNLSHIHITHVTEIDNRLTKNNSNFNTKKHNLEKRTYGEVVFDSKLMSSKNNKKLIEDCQSQNQQKLENLDLNNSQNNSVIEKANLENSKTEIQNQNQCCDSNVSLKNSKTEIQNESQCSDSDVETVYLKIRPPNFKSKLKSPVKISDSISKSNSDLKEKRQTVIETCEKVDVNKLPDPSHITTPFIDVNIEDINNDQTEVTAIAKLNKSQNQPTKIPVLTKPLSSSVKSKSLPSSPLKETESEFVARPNSTTTVKQPSDLSVSLPTSTVTTPDGSKNGIIVAKLEFVETKIKVTSNDTPPGTPEVSHKFLIPLKSPVSPKINSKTHPDPKPKNIFDFLRKNFSSNTNDTDNEITDTGAVAVENSKFYIPLTEKFNNSTNDVNIEITKTIKTDRIVEKADSIDSDATMTNEINQLLDEELSKLTTIEDTRL